MDVNTELVWLFDQSSVVCEMDVCKTEFFWHHLNNSQSVQSHEKLSQANHMKNSVNHMNNSQSGQVLNWNIA
jgi:hypothetical protein